MIKVYHVYIVLKHWKPEINLLLSSRSEKILSGVLLNCFTDGRMALCWPAQGIWSRWSLNTVNTEDLCSFTLLVLFGSFCHFWTLNTCPFVNNMFTEKRRKGGGGETVREWHYRFYIQSEICSRLRTLSHIAISVWCD